MRALVYFVLYLLLQCKRHLGATWRRAALRGSGVRLSANVQLLADKGCAITLAPGVSVGTGTLLIAARDPVRPGEAGVLEIGRGTAVNEYCNLRASGACISIGAGCMLAQFVTLVGSNHGMDPAQPMQRQPWDLERRGIVIGDDVWIGANAVILPGVKIGKGAVVAAGAVVNKDIPEFDIWAGVPARRVGSRHDARWSAQARGGEAR
jgi:acetyltransferase-like isoleucine patch superfamily enzyme